MRIGEVAHRAGVSTRALRYYEEQGLLAPERTPSGQRTYPESAVERVNLIQQLFTAGLPSRTILQLMPYIEAGHGSLEAFELMAAERNRITAAMADLAAARNALDRMIDIANHPTPEHCPALREPAWAPYNAAGATAVAASPAGGQTNDLLTESGCDETADLSGECDETSRCEVCRGPIARAPTGRPARYCSRACQARAYRARKEMHVDDGPAAQR
jgi:DNA-binding transcriptional MerR regulator